MTLSAGTRLGPYEIVAPLGAGGMGEVYRAKDTRLGREVAVKVLPASFSQDADRLRRFEQEARSASALNHPNIVTLHDIGSHDGAPYVVTELLEGDTLRAQLATGKLSPRKSTEYAIQIAQGLAAAHEKGIVHRDLKPENLFVTEDGRVKILDFGLAKLVQPETPGQPQTSVPTASQGTEPGVVMGTVGYMSPEQVKGVAVDHRSDIFSFGAILYEMLSGRRAFRGDSAVETMSAILKEDPPELSETNKALSPGLDRVVRHCFEKSPAQRFQSSRDIVFALEAAATPGTSAPVAAVPPRARFPLRRTLGILALLAVGAALGYLARRGSSTGASPRWETGSLAPLTTEPGYAAEPTFSPDGETIAYVSDREGNYEIYLQQVSGGPAINLTKNPAADIQPAFSPDGREIAFVSTRASGTDAHVAGPNLPLAGGDIWVMPALGGAARRIAERGNFPSWSPDGRSILFTHGGFRQSRVAIVAAEGGQPRDIELEGGPVARLFYPSSSGDGRWILLGNGTEVGVVASGGGKWIHLADGETPAWGPGSQSIVFTNNAPGKNRTLWEIPFSPERGEALGPAQPLTFGRGADLGAAVSKDGRKIVFSSLDMSSNLEEVPLDAESGRAVGPPTELTRGANRIGFFGPSPDGKSVVFAATRGSDVHLWRVDSPGAPVQLTFDASYREGSPRWSPDGSEIAFLRRGAQERGDRYALWLMKPDGTGPRKLTDAARQAEWMDSGRLLISRGVDELAVVDARTGSTRPLAQVQARTLFAIEPTAEWLAIQTSERGNMDIAAVPISGGTPRLVVATPREDYHAFFSPSGRWLYFLPNHKNIHRVPGPAQQWKSAEPERVTDFPEAGLYLEDPSISRDGTKLVYTRGRTTGGLWLLRRGEPEGEAKPR